MMGGYAEMKWKQEQLTITGVPYRCRACEVGQHDKAHAIVHCWNCGAFMERGNILSGTALLTSAGALSADQRGDVENTNLAQGMVQPDHIPYPEDFDIGARIAQEIVTGL